MNSTPQSAPGRWQRAIIVVLALLPMGFILMWWPTRRALLYMQFMWVVTGLILALSVVFFVAAWRKGVRWLVSRRALTFHLEVAVCLLTFVALYYAEESWRGKRAWAHLQREAGARGESLEFTALAPPAVPEDQNFATAPGVPQLLTRTNPAGRFPAFYHGEEYHWPWASWGFQQFTDFDAWQKSLTGFGRVLPRNRGGQEAMGGPDAAAGLLAVMDRFATNLATVRAASERPALRLPVDYSKGFFAGEDILPALRSIRWAAHLFTVRASAYLGAGRDADASADVLASLRLADLLGQEPFNYAQHARQTILTDCVQPVWEGLATHRWNESQLAAFQDKFSAPDIVDGYGRSVHEQMLTMMSLLDEALAFVGRRPSEFERRFPPENRGGGAMFWIIRAVYPLGWLYQDKVWVYRFYQRHHDPFDPSGPCGESGSWAAEYRGISDPMLLTFVVPKLKEVSGAGPEALLIQTFVRQAETACALERFRLAHGEYPDTLEALVPAYLRQVPPDILARTNSFLKYGRTSDGGFQLYSVGLDRTDNGGQPASPPKDTQFFSIWSLDQKGRDLVWAQPGRR